MTDTKKDSQLPDGQVPEDVDLSDTTGHVWDGIAELNTPLPKWWLYVMWATVIWSLAYWVVMPAWPWPVANGFTPGVSGYSQRDTVDREIAAAMVERGKFESRIAALDLDAIRNDPELLEVANAAGAAAFGDNCAPCHGAGAQGGPGFPNLNDDDWLWGGTLEEIQATIAHGIRWENDDDTRYSEMPRFGADELLSAEEISQVAHFVLSLGGNDHDASKVEAGATIFADNCGFCHGEAGEGMREMGAPNLRDAIWLYGGSEADIVNTITNARFGVMPAWQGRLGEATIKELALYVHGLGGGE